MDNVSAVNELVSSELSRSSTSWSIGVLGAIAEFHHDDDEPLKNGGTCVVTDRGAIRIDLTTDTRAVAYEIVTQKVDSWNHGVALCLPQGRCEMNGRRVITEVGRDAAALRPEDRDAILFDLGLGSPYCDFQVRTRDPEQLSALRAACGKSLFDPSHDLAHEIPHWSPHRVFVSRLGRIEVYQSIGKPHGVTPEGPHTHLLPKLLRTNRTHSANVALPRGWVPCATLYPANPVRDDHGNAKPFEAETHHAFQALYARHAETDLVGVKREVLGAVRRAERPKSFEARRHRTAARIALRQMLYTDGTAPALSDWRRAFEPALRLDSKPTLE